MLNKTRSVGFKIRANFQYIIMRLIWTTVIHLETNIITNLISGGDGFFQESWGDFLEMFIETIFLKTKTKKLLKHLFNYFSIEK